MEEETVEGIRRVNLPVTEGDGVTRIRPKAPSADPAAPEGAERLLEIIDVVCPHCLHRRRKEVPMKNRRVGKADVRECPECGSVLLDGDRLDIRHYKDHETDETFVVYDEHGHTHQMIDE